VKVDDPEAQTGCGQPSGHASRSPGRNKRMARRGSEAQRRSAESRRRDAETSGQTAEHKRSEVGRGRLANSGGITLHPRRLRSMVRRCEPLRSVTVMTAREISVGGEC
jgi:hypothetical protein